MTTLQKRSRKKLRRSKQVDDRVHIFVPFVCSKCGSLNIEVSQNLSSEVQTVQKEILGREFIFGISDDINRDAKTVCADCGNKSPFEVFSWIRISKDEFENRKLSSSTLERLEGKYDVRKAKRGRKKVISVDVNLDDPVTSLEDLFPRMPRAKETNNGRSRRGRKGGGKRKRGEA